jgi:isochorismate hydrolase
MHFLPHMTAFVPIDCQSVFYGAAQGTCATALVAQKIDHVVPSLTEKGVAVYAIYSKAQTPEQAGLLCSLRAGFCMAKTHESAVIGSNLLDLLRKARRPNIVVAGFHLTTCVTLTAMHLRLRGYNVAVASDLCGEGQRRRNLCEGELQEKIDAAHMRLSQEGISVRPLAQILG